MKGTNAEGALYLLCLIRWNSCCITNAANPCDACHKHSDRANAGCADLCAVVTDSKCYHDLKCRASGLGEQVKDGQVFRDCQWFSGQKEPDNLVYRSSGSQGVELVQNFTQADQAAASSTPALYLSWAVVHSSARMSSRGPRKTGW